jgi:5,10-methylene-tetrahydrofolate dehydrogenase/methenyl tetrahydrofolate cyclohydrolase
MTNINQQIIQIKNHLIQEIQNAKTNNKKLGIIQVGNKSESNLYIKLKIKQLKKFDIEHSYIKLPKDCSQKEIEKAIQKFNKEASIGGYIIQSPIMSKNVNIQKAYSLIDKNKDIDCLNPINQGLINLNKEKYLPATVKAISLLLPMDLTGKSILIINDSYIVGRPLSSYLLNKNATVTIANKHTKNLNKLINTNEIIITGTGQANLINPENIEKDKFIIDFGITRHNNKTVGDVNKACYLKSNNITKTPGGVGPLTILSLIHNFYMV